MYLFIPVEILGGLCTVGVTLSLVAFILNIAIVSECNDSKWYHKFIVWLCPIIFIFSIAYARFLFLNG